jgi:hypothetical protein
MKRLLPLSFVLLSFVALPTSAAAATHHGGVIETDISVVRAYKMTVIALTATPHNSAFVAISFSRGTSGDHEQHYYQFASHKVHVTLAPGGASGTIKADLGPFGRIDMTFSAGTGRVTPGCQGAALFEHTGTLSGTFHFVSQSSYFKTVDRSSLRAFTATGKKGTSCRPTKPMYRLAPSCVLRLSCTSRICTASG